MGVVEKDDTIYIPAKTLTENKVTVEWEQNLSKKSQEYYSVPFFNKSKGKTTVGENLTIVVDDSFQYGQKKEKTQRWLAYHDKGMNAFQ